MTVDQPVLVVCDEPSPERVPPFVDRRERCDPQQLLFERVVNHPVIPLSSVTRTEARLRRDSDEVKKVWFVWLRVVAVVHLSQEDHPS